MVVGRRLLPIFIAAALLVSVSWRLGAAGWSATFGTAADGEGFDAVYPTADGAYLASGAGGKHLTKISAAGEVIWSRATMAPPATGYYRFLPGGDGFLLVNYGSLVVRLNGLGEAVWWGDYGDGYLHLSAARPLPGGDILVGGSQFSAGTGVNSPFIARLAADGQILWQKLVTLPGMTGGNFDRGYLRDLLPLRDGGFLALMNGANVPDDPFTTTDYVARFSDGGAVVWARALTRIVSEDTRDAPYVMTLVEAAGGGYFAYGYGLVIALDATGDVQGFRQGLPWSPDGIHPTPDGGCVVAGGDQAPGGVARVQKLDRQLGSEWLRVFGSGASSGLGSIAPAPAGGWIVGGKITPAGRSDSDGWIFRLASGGHSFGSCPAAVLAEPDLGNGRRRCEVQVTRQPAPPYAVVATVTRCDLPAVPPGFSPVRQDFDFACGPGAQSHEVRCTVATRHNFGGNFMINLFSTNRHIHVAPGASAEVGLGFDSTTSAGTYFITAYTNGSGNIASGPAAISTLPGSAEARIIPGFPWFAHGLSRNLLCAGEREGCPFDPALDTDADSLSDCLETYGLSDPVSGRMLLDLPSLGANPFHKDVFVEVDYLTGTDHSHRPKPQAIALAERALAELPVGNPDGSRGVSLHVDYGQWGALSESDSFAGYDSAFLYDQDAGSPWKTLEELKDKPVAAGRLGFSINRRGIFHYSVFGHRINPEGASGAARPVQAVAGADFVVTLGGWTGGVGSIQEQAGTFLHELGHNLGLDHGGADKVAQKPNYRSVMSYDFQTSPLLSYSNAALPTLEEAQLDELAGIGAADWTIYRCPSGAARYVANGSAIDWNCNSPTSTPAERAVAVDVNGGPETRLAGFADADGIVFDGIRPAGLAGAASSGPVPRELTAEQDRAIPKPEKLLVEAVAPVVPLAWGETRQVAFRLSNLGEEGDTYDLFVYSTAGHALGGAPGPIALGRGESTLVEVAVTAPAEGVPAVSDLVLIATGRRRPELAEEAAAQIATGNSGPLRFYTLTPCRLADTRPASPLRSGLSRIFPVGSHCGVPSSARAIAANVTVTQPSSGGHVTLFPAGQVLPASSTINFGPGQVRANNAILQLGDDAGLAAVSFSLDGGGVHLILDVTGYFESP